MNAILFLLAGSVMSPPSHWIECQNSGMDLGDIKCGAPLIHTFKLINPTKDRTYDITGVKLSCGCSKHSVDRETLKPGETANFTVKINTLAQAAGAWSWSATVQYKKRDGISDEDPLLLTLRAKLIREITITPPGLAFSLEAGTVTQEIVIHDTRATPLTIKGTTASAAHLKAVLKAGDKPGQYRVAVTVDDNAPGGNHRDTIVLATNDASYPELLVPVQVTKNSPARVKAYPAEVFAEDGAAEVSLRRPDGKMLQIANCELEASGIAIKWSKEAALMQRITLRGSVAQKAGQSLLKVTLAEPANEIVLIAVNWAR